MPFLKKGFVIMNKSPPSLNLWGRCCGQSTIVDLVKALLYWSNSYHFVEISLTEPKSKMKWLKKELNPKARLDFSQKWNEKQFSFPLKNDKLTSKKEFSENYGNKKKISEM